MRQYDSYYGSDVPWIGQIPKSWKMIPNKVLFQKTHEVVGEEFYKHQLLSLTTTGVKKKDINDNKGKTPTSFEGYQKVSANDMIFCLFDLDVSAVFSGLSRLNGMITSAYDVTKCNSSLIHSSFADYWFQFVFSYRYYKMYAKNVRYTIAFDLFGSLKTPIPPLSEQEQIVRFLDWKVSDINKLVNIKRKEIGLLKEQLAVYISNIIVTGVANNPTTKPCDIEWIGEIPAHWSIMKCKYLFKERDERSVEGKETHLSMSQKYGLIPDDQLDERRMLSESYAGAKICYKNDLVLNRLKAHLGVFALAPQLGVISPDYTVLIPNTDRILPEFAEMVLKSQRCRRELRIRVRGVTEGFWRLYTDDFNTISIPVPPLEEQQQIMDAVSSYLDKIKQYESCLTKEIEVLHEFKTRLISDVVTGKIDVRGIEIPEYEYTAEEADPDSEAEDDEMEEGDDEV